MTETAAAREREPDKINVIDALGDLINRYESAVPGTHGLHDLPDIINQNDLGYVDLAPDQVESLRILLGNYVDANYDDAGLQAILNYLKGTH